MVEIKRQRLLSGAKLPSCVRKEGALRRRFSRGEVGGIQAVRIRFVLAGTHDVAATSRKCCGKWIGDLSACLVSAEV